MNIGMDVKPDGAVILKRVIIVVLVLYDLVSMMWIKQQIYVAVGCSTVNTFVFLLQPKTKNFELYNGLMLLDVCYMYDIFYTHYPSIPL